MHVRRPGFSADDLRGVRSIAKDASTRYDFLSQY
jgi:hypothetical protein